MIVVAGKEVVPPCRDVHHDDRRREKMKFYLGNKRIRVARIEYFKFEISCVPGVIILMVPIT